MSEQKVVPRFIPTLTEVVEPASISPTPRPQKPDTHALAQQIQQELQAQLQRRLQQEFAQFQQGFLNEQLEAMRVRLSVEFDRLLRQALAEKLGLGAGDFSFDGEPRVFTDS